MRSRSGFVSMRRQLGIFGLVVGAISTALGVKQASDAKKAGKRSEEQERLATEERVRQLDIEKKAVTGTQRANAAASGVKVGSASVLAVQTETIDEIEREKKFVRQAGAFSADAAKLQGRVAAYQGYGTALTGAGQIFSAISDRRNRNNPPSV